MSVRRPSTPRDSSSPRPSDSSRRSVGDAGDLTPPAGQADAARAANAATAATAANKDSPAHVRVEEMAGHYEAHVSAGHSARHVDPARREVPLASGARTTGNAPAPILAAALGKRLDTPAESAAGADSRRSTRMRKSRVELASEQRGTLAKIVKRARILERLGAAIRDALDPVTAARLVGLSLRSDCIVLIAASPVWASKLRFASPDILALLETLPPYAHIQRCRVVVSPDTLPAPGTTVVPKNSAFSANRATRPQGYVPTVVAGAGTGAGHRNDSSRYHGNRPPSPAAATLLSALADTLDDPARSTNVPPSGAADPTAGTPGIASPHTPNPGLAAALRRIAAARARG